MATDIGGIITPSNATPPNQLGAVITNMANGLEISTVLHFPTAATRDTKLPYPTLGLLAFLENPGIFSWYSSRGWQPLMNNVTQEKKGNFYSGGLIGPNTAQTAYDEDITVSGPCVIEADVSMILTVGAGVTAAGYVGIQIGGITVRNARYHNYGSSALIVATVPMGVANVGAAQTINVKFNLNNDGTSNGNVQVRDVNYAIRERSPR